MYPSTQVSRCCKDKTEIDIQLTWLAFIWFRRKQKYQNKSYEATDFFYGLTNFDVVEINNANKTIDKVDVWLGKEDQVEVYVNENIYKTIKKAKKRLLKLGYYKPNLYQLPITC